MADGRTLSSQHQPAMNDRRKKNTDGETEHVETDEISLLARLKHSGSLDLSCLAKTIACAPYMVRIGSAL